jgi:hypothetical protein
LAGRRLGFTARQALHTASTLRIQEVGVFAVKNIQKGTVLFSEDLDEVRWVKIEDLAKDP